MLIICPRCRSEIEIDNDLRHYIKSVRLVGCDDCLRRLAYEQQEGKIAA